VLTYSIEKAKRSPVSCSTCALTDRDEPKPSFTATQATVFSPRASVQDTMMSQSSAATFRAIFIRLIKRNMTNIVATPKVTAVTVTISGR